MIEIGPHLADVLNTILLVVLVLGEIIACFIVTILFLGEGLAMLFVLWVILSSIWERKS